MSNITVFLADDHAIVRDGLRYLLDAQPDIKVIGDAANGRDAVQLVSELCPDIVLKYVLPRSSFSRCTQQSIIFFVH
jgi:YesN/AraC family two-component response regulator